MLTLLAAVARDSTATAHVLARSATAAAPGIDWDVISLKSKKQKPFLHGG